MTPRVYTDMPFAAYVELDGVNWSTLKKMNESPKEYRHAIDFRDSNDTSSRQQFRANHAAVLEPHNLQRKFPVYPGNPERKEGAKIVRSGKHFKDWAAQQEEGSTSVLERVHRIAQRVADAVHTDERAHRWLSGGFPESVIQWQCRRTGIICKAMLDYRGEMAGGAWVAELKNVKSINPRPLGTTAAREMWHGQIAHYVDGLQTLLGYDEDSGLVKARLVCVKTNAAHDVGVFQLTEDHESAAALWAGMQLRHKLMERLAECLEEDRWPGRFDGVEEILELPQWAHDDDEEDEDA